MSPRYMEALVEVDYVLTRLDKNDIEKIPLKFREFINKNKAKRYEISSIENLREETLAILAIIYRKFLAPLEEREILEKEFERKLKQEKENIVRDEKYSIPEYNVKIASDINKESINKENLLVAEYSKNNWWNKFLGKLRNLLKLKKW